MTRTCVYEQQQQRESSSQPNLGKFGKPPPPEPPGTSVPTPSAFGSSSNSPDTVNRRHFVALLERELTKSNSSNSLIGTSSGSAVQAKPVPVCKPRPPVPAAAISKKVHTSVTLTLWQQ